MSYLYISTDVEKTRQSSRDKAVFELSCIIDEIVIRPDQFDRAVASLLYIDRLAQCTPPTSSSRERPDRKYCYRLGPFSKDTMVKYLTHGLTHREGHPDLFGGSMDICDVIGESELRAKLVAAVDDVYNIEGHISDARRDAASAFHAEEEHLYRSSMFLDVSSAVALKNEGLVVMENGDDLIFTEAYPALLKALLSCSRISPTSHKALEAAALTSAFKGALERTSRVLSRVRSDPAMRWCKQRLTREYTELVHTSVNR